MTGERRRRARDRGHMEMSKNTDSRRVGAEVLPPPLPLPQVSHQGDLTIGENIVLRCYVLEDGTRVLSRMGMLKAIGRQRQPKSAPGC